LTIAEDLAQVGGEPPKEQHQHRALWAPLRAWPVSSPWLHGDVLRVVVGEQGQRKPSKIRAAYLKAK